MNDYNFCKGIYDSGSNISIISKNLLDFLKIKDFKFSNESFKMVSGYGKICGIAKIKVKIFNKTKKVFIFVLDSKYFNYDMLIGLDLIKEFCLCQDANLNIFQHLDRKLSFQHKNWKNNPIIVNFLQMQADLDHLDKDKKFKISKIIRDFNATFAQNKYDVGKVRDHVATVKLTEHKYVYRKPYRCNIIDQREIESQISKLLEAGLIEESTSPFAAPVTLAYKKYLDGKKKKDRLCIDFSALNKIIIPESQPFPLIEDLIIKARDCKWFSVLDINSAFWSVPLREKDRYKTAFVTQTGHYNWKCLPFGLKTSPAIFQRILRNALKRNGLDDFSVNYIDDILVFSKTFDEHMDHLRKLLQAIHDEGFRLSLNKCNFAKSRVKYLGHIIENNRILPIHDNVIPVQNFPTPRNQKNIRQFLGKINFYRAYIPNSSKTLAPLHNLLKKNVKFIWDDRCEKSFKVIKDCLCSEPCLAIYDPTKETIVQTDASLEGMGAILKQKQEDGTFKPVAYFSKKLNEAQKKKKAIFLECLAIKEALMYWRHHLLPLKFKVFTDHKPLENMKINTKFDQELRELMLQISHFNFEIKYTPGASNQEADCLSRNPVLEPTDATSELKIVNFIEKSEILKDQRKNFKEFSNKINIINKENVLFSKLKNSDKVIVSDEFCKEIVRKTHLKYGHIGPGQMKLTLCPFLHNVNLRKFIKNFCNNCSTCIQNKTRIPVKFGPLSQLGPATKPFEYMSMDTVGGFKGNNSPKVYFHLLVDHFTRFAYAISSKNQKSADFIRLLNLVLKDGNKIENLLTDQYAGITSNDFKDFVADNNINLIFTAVDSPSSNGLNERLNQTLVNRLRCKVNENFKNKKKPWSTLLVDCINEYNNTIHSVTKFSPNYLLNNVKFSPFSFFQNNVNNLESDRKIAFKNSALSHQRNKKYFDKKRRVFDFQVGDLVYVNHGNSLNRNKLDPIRLGPYKIINRISNAIYELDSGFRKKESNIFHVSKLYPYATI